MPKFQRNATSRIVGTHDTPSLPHPRHVSLVDREHYESSNYWSIAVFGMVDWGQCKHSNHTAHGPYGNQAGRVGDQRMATRTGTPITNPHSMCESLSYLRFRVFSSSFQPVTGRSLVGIDNRFSQLQRTESHLFPAYCTQGCWQMTHHPSAEFARKKRWAAVG